LGKACGVRLDLLTFKKGGSHRETFQGTLMKIETFQREEEVVEVHGKGPWGQACNVAI